MEVLTKLALAWHRWIWNSRRRRRHFSRDTHSLRTLDVEGIPVGPCTDLRDSRARGYCGERYACLECSWDSTALLMIQ